MKISSHYVDLYETSYLGFHLPTRDGSLSVISGLELQSDRARADVGDGQVGGRTRQLCGGKTAVK